MQGVVKWFDDEKGFGFIAPSEGGKDVFVHYSKIEGSGHRTLMQGDRVEFDVGEHGGRPEAVAVEKLDAGDVNDNARSDP